MQGFDVSRPNVARMYSYALSGKDNFAADREAAYDVLRAVPDAFRCAHQNRGFLKRAVGLVAGAGTAQFIDIGCGMPAEENTHEIAQAACPSARVVYVDHDPVVLTHARSLLESAPQVHVVAGDLREPQDLLESPALRALLDDGRPVAVVLGSVLHFVGGQEAYKVVDHLKQAMPAGSYLLISHATGDYASRREIHALHAAYGRTHSPLTLRTAAEIAGFFDGLELFGPGLTSVEKWRNPAAEATARTLCYGGVARKC